MKMDAMEWIRGAAQEFGDLPTPLLELCSSVTVVGMGAGTRGAHELADLQLGIVRLLVEQAGFRAVALDADWTVGMALDEVVRSGNGDLSTVLRSAQPIWHTAEMLELVEWVRGFNRRHPGDKVRLLGANVGEVDESAYDAVSDFVSTVAPERLGELTDLYAELRPTDGVSEQVRRYQDRTDRRSWIDRARAARDLVAELAGRTDDREMVLQHAEVIVNFYELHDHGDRASDPGHMSYLERRLADHIAWWHRRTGQRIVFWSADTHTANGATRAVRFPPHPPRVHRNAGSHLRERFGSAYVSIGLTFHDGELASGRAAPYRIKGASAELVESVLGGVGMDRYVLDLRGSNPPATVAEWLAAPALTRVIGPSYDPDQDAAHHMAGGSLSEWFDAIVHCQHVTPTQPLTRGTNHT